MRLALGIDADYGIDGPIPGIRRHRKIRGAVNAHRLWVGRNVVRPDPLGLEIIAVLRSRLLLKEGGPHHGTGLTLPLAQEAPVVVPLWLVPQVFAGLAPDRIVLAGNRWNVDHLAPDMPGLDLRNDAPGHVKLVPAGVHHDAFGPRLQPWPEIVHIPVPALLPHRVGPRILTIAEQIVTQPQIRTKAADALAGADRVIFAALVERELVRSARCRRHADAQHIALVGHVVADTPAPAMRKVVAVGGE